MGPSHHNFFIFKTIHYLAGEDDSDEEVAKKSRRHKIVNGGLFYRRDTTPRPDSDVRSWPRQLHLEYGHPSASSLARTVAQEVDWESRVEDVDAGTAECDSCERGEEVIAPKAALKAKRADWIVNDK